MFHSSWEKTDVFIYVFGVPNPHIGDILECTDAAQLHLFVQVFHLAKVSPKSCVTQCMSLTSFTPSALLTDGSPVQNIIDLALGDLENLSIKM